VGSSEFSGCYNCGSKNHIKFDCKKAKKERIPRSDTSKFESEFNRRKIGKGSEQYANESESDDSGNESHMIGDCVVMGEVQQEEEVLLTEEFTGKDFLDSCAS
jgi:hypothetical protein